MKKEIPPRSAELRGAQATGCCMWKPIIAAADDFLPDASPERTAPAASAAGSADFVAAAAVEHRTDDA